jgi:hypothetical protein
MTSTGDATTATERDETESNERAKSTNGSEE